jgi:hypothetical protein
LRVVTGELLLLEISERKATYYGDFEHTPDDRVVKPTPRALDIVELEPGEMVRLKTIIGPMEKTVERYRVIYEISESLGSSVGCWKGKVETAWAMQCPPAKVESK